MRLTLILSLSALLSACSHTPPSRLHGFSVATVQYPMEGGKTASELANKIEAFVRDAKARGAGLIVFPELIALDSWPEESVDPESSIVANIADSITPALFPEIKRMAREQGLAILAGSFPRRVKSRIRNTAFLAFPDGREILHDKIFLTGWEKEMNWEAGAEIAVFDSPWGKSTLLICYDIEFPAMAQALAGPQPEVVLVPSMTETFAGLQRVRWAAQSRAVELHAYVVVSGTVGEIGKDWIHYGQNVFLSPRDPNFPVEVIEGKMDRPGIVMGELDLPRLRESRQKTKFAPAADPQNRVPIQVRR